MRGFGIVVIGDQQIKFLLLDAGNGRFGIAGTVEGDAEVRQNSAKNIRRGIIGRNQQCLKIHNLTGVRPGEPYGHRGAAGRPDFAAEAPALAPAFAAMASEPAESSTSARTALSSSSFSASNGATSRSFSAACCSISICLPS